MERRSEGEIKSLLPGWVKWTLQKSSQIKRSKLNHRNPVKLRRTTWFHCGEGDAYLLTDEGFSLVAVQEVNTDGILLSWALSSAGLISLASYPHPPWQQGFWIILSNLAMISGNRHYGWVFQMYVFVALSTTVHQVPSSSSIFERNQVGGKV